MEARKHNSRTHCVLQSVPHARKLEFAKAWIQMGFQQRLELLASCKYEEHDKQNEEEHYEDEQVLTFQEEDQEAPSENHDYEGENEEQRNKCCKVVQCAPNRIGVL